MRDADQQIFSVHHTVQDDYVRGKIIRLTNEAVSVLLLRPLKTEQRLKLSRTELLTVMESTQVNPQSTRDLSHSSLTGLPFAFASTAAVTQWH